jgi:CelD/BcsL family acetyltransferase involved in cellulose biosynthesis
VSELEFLGPDDSRWRAFAESEPDVLPFHLPPWSALLAEAYGFRPRVAALVDQGSVTGGLPLLELRRRRWAALPFTDVCPPLGDAAAITRALDAARGRARIEVRAPLPGSPDAVVGLRHVLALAPDVYERFHPSQVRRNIKRAEREGVVVREAAREEDLTQTFYALHVRTRRRLGAPVQRRRFFSLLWRHVLEPGHGYALLAHHDGRPAAGAVFLAAGRTVVYKYGASDERLWSVRPNHALFWAAIRRSCDEGRTRFDFGRTDLDDDGLRAFKLAWGAAEEELVYSVLGGQAHAPRGSRAARAARRTLQASPPWVCRAAGLLYGFAA